MAESASAKFRVGMSRPPPQPIFVHHGFMGGVTSCALINKNNCNGLLVGTTAGRCELYDAETYVLIRTVYGDFYLDSDFILPMCSFSLDNKLEVKVYECELEEKALQLIRNPMTDESGARRFEE
ncbi:hypothetical protein NECAME_13771 [Necator americanus]|uniref:Uncharacterized protein n=1 Tax=Necator americanus TaxID=51031 RepID=W2ST86_NECAM|nr:hypothetical protein NECAME_13771 [Necator americanus]ETN72723.1 hypothetical protein NECAME_13771 [Necator americanus]